jgi:hypothetical protein
VTLLLAILASLALGVAAAFVWALGAAAKQGDRFLYAQRAIEKREAMSKVAKPEHNGHGSLGRRRVR